MDKNEFVWQFAGLINEAEEDMSAEEVRQAALGYIGGRQWEDDPENPFAMTQ